MNQILHIVEALSFFIGIIGVLVLVFGVFKGFIKFLMIEVHIIDNDHANQARKEVRHDLGYYLLLGMEFLVAADIIHTILSPTLGELAILGSIVAIRVVLSHFLQVELANEKKEKTKKKKPTRKKTK